MANALTIDWSGTTGPDTTTDIFSYYAEPFSQLWWSGRSWGKFQVQLQVQTPEPEAAADPEAAEPTKIWKNTLLYCLFTKI